VTVTKTIATAAGFRT